MISKVRAWGAALGVAALVAAGGPAPTWAGEPSEILLDDGSVIRGEILSMSDGAYSIRSPSVGVIKVDESRVLSIVRGGGAAASESPSEPDLEHFEAEVERLRHRFLADPGTMDTLGSLQEDPDFQRVLRDDDLMSAVRGNDLETLMNDPRIQELGRHPAVRQLLDGQGR